MCLSMNPNQVYTLRAPICNITKISPVTLVSSSSPFLAWLFMRLIQHSNYGFKGTSLMKFGTVFNSSSQEVDCKTLIENSIVM